jgi:iron(III) transport system ATP-binding protein
MSNCAPPQAVDAALAVAGLRRRYGETAAVDGVSFAAAAGEILCLLGHSGCGKTTLLRLIAGLEPPDEGEVRLCGETVSTSGRFVPAERRRVGLVFQDYALFPHLDARANVAFGLSAMPRSERDSAAAAALARVRMQHKQHDYPHMLSGGEQQRVALARALAPAPQLLLMDEPFSNLDRRLRDSVRDETIALLRESRTTAVVVTHDPEEALCIADRIVLMHRGRVEQIGSPETLYRRPASLFVARFFSALNELEAEVRDGQAQTALGGFAADGLTNGAAVVTLRPQDLAIADDGTGPVARVESVQFLGDAWQLRLRVDRLVEPLNMRTSATRAPLPGSVVRLRLQRDAALVFPSPCVSHP